MAGRGDPMPEEEMRAEESGQAWADLVPTDVLHLVALRLPPPDLSSFQKVCKPWRSLPMESYPLGRSPLFLFKGYGRLTDRKDMLCLYSPLYNMTFSWAASSEVLDIFNSPQSYIKYSMDGWLVFFMFHKPPDDGHIVFVNPFLPSTTTATVIKWRMPKQCDSSTLASMSAPPTDPACILLLMNYDYVGIDIITGSEGGTNWNVDSFDCDYERPHSSIVFHGDAFYFSMRLGGLAIFNPRRRTLDYLVAVPSYRFEMESLVESDGELFKVVMNRARVAYMFRINPHVYKLNESSMGWEELTELRGRALFVHKRRVTAAVAEVDGMKDRIFFNRFLYTGVGVDYELHWSAGGDLRFFPRPHVGLAKLARRAGGKLEGLSLPYSSEHADKKAAEEPWTPFNGAWVQPNWGQ